MAVSHRQKGLDIQTKPWYYSYRKDGKLSQATTPDGTERTYQYDSLGNNTLYKAGPLSKTTKFTYLGQPDKITMSSNGLVTDSVDYTYNEKDLLVSKTTGSETTSYGYNTLGNLISMTSPSGLVRSYTRDELERITEVSADGKQFSYEYYGDGLIKKITYPTADMYTEYTYDNANRLRRLTTYSGSTILKSYVYDYDGVGNIISVSGSENVIYTYDPLYRLKTSTKDGVTTTYAYDSRDNLISEIRPGYSKTYEYGGDNRLYKITENGIVTEYDYDLNGNLIKRGEDEFGYDAYGRMVYSKVGGATTTYEIGADGLRKSKTTGGVTTTYQLDENGNVISENGDEIIAGNRPLAKKIDGVYYYYIYNGHGDVVSVVDETGKVHRNFTYDDWGQPQNAVMTRSLIFDDAPQGITTQNPKQYLSDMEWISGEAARNESAYSGAGYAVYVGGISYQKGISFTRNGGEVKIKLNGEYSSFHSVIGIDYRVDADDGRAYFQVNCTYMDGTSNTLYTSYSLYSDSTPVALDLSMENVDVLTLKVIDGNYGDDYGCWADAYVIRKEVPADPAGVTYVSDMEWTQPLYVYRNTTALGTEPSIGGIARSKGISFMKNACSITVDLNGEYATFVSDIGVDDMTPYTFSPEMTFYVYGDDELLYQSGALKACDPAESISVDVTGVQQMRLVVSCSTYDNHYYEAYGNWSGAYVTPPVYDAPPTDDPALEDPFYGGTPGGEIVGEVNPDPALDSMQYAGEYYDAETGLIYLRNRYYDPATSRMLSEDPAKQGLNWYVYCSNNPVNRIDPSGLKDYVYTSQTDYYVENDWGFWEFLNTDRYYAEIGGSRYQANSKETVTLYDWNSFDTDFLNGTLDSLVSTANTKSTNAKRILSQSIGGDLDFKLQMDKEKLYLANGILYNKNEAGNFVWAYFLESQNYSGYISGALAQGGSIISPLINMNGLPRLDEEWDRQARWSGVKYYYDRNNSWWLYYLLYGGRPKY